MTKSSDSISHKPLVSGPTPLVVTDSGSVDCPIKGSANGTQVPAMARYGGGLVEVQDRRILYVMQARDSQRDIV